MKILVTGAAGFIGFHTAKVLLQRGDAVVGLDNLNDYYDVSLKQARLAQLAQYRGRPSEALALLENRRLFLLNSASAAQLHRGSRLRVRYDLGCQRQKFDRLRNHVINS